MFARLCVNEVHDWKQVSQQENIEELRNMDLVANQLERFRRAEARIGVVGLGYVGLPLVDAFLRVGFEAVGFDTDPRKVEMLGKGESYIAHVPSTSVREWNLRGSFDATADMSRLSEVDVILICVPTPLSDSRDPDLSYVVGTAEAISKVLRPGQLVILESTTFPGTTRDIVLPVLEKSGLQLGRDYFLAYSPEREDPGNSNYSTSSIPKVVGGIDKNSLDLANALYSSAVERTVPVASLEVAESCKILENMYRSINIAMVNELKILFEKLGIDIWEVIEAAKTKPFGFQAFYPGPGLGGHCIPIDPFYMSWVARKHEIPAKFIELAGEINTGMPLHVVHRVADALNKNEKSISGSKIGILGVAYKKDVDDPRESPSFKIMELLFDRGAELSYVDSHIPILPKMRSFCVPELVSQEPTEEYLRSLDCTLIATDHSHLDYTFIAEHSQLVVDTRNATSCVIGDRSHIVKA